MVVKERHLLGSDRRIRVSGHRAVQGSDVHCGAGQCNGDQEAQRRAKQRLDHSAVIARSWGGVGTPFYSEGPKGSNQPHCGKMRIGACFFPNSLRDRRNRLH